MQRKKFFPVVAMVFYKKGKYLLTRRKDGRSKYNGKWQFPGGGWEAEESLEEALNREVKEEMGFEAKNYRFLPKIFEEVREKYRLIFFIFYAPFPKNAKIVLNEEADKYGWFSVEEAKKIPSLPLTVEILQEVEKTINEK